MDIKKIKKLVPEITKLLQFHHSIYESKCKAEYWEELCARAFKNTGIGSNWAPDYNHTVSIDQLTDTGIPISNKSGAFCSRNKRIKLSGSRLTSHQTLNEKIDFISKHNCGYIFCLATDNKDWDNNKVKYYFIVIDTKQIDYTDLGWEPVPTGYRGEKNGVIAEIKTKMSSQLWTTINSSKFLVLEEITL